MDVWPTQWAKVCFVEANKLWFYSLVCSILGSVVQFSAGDREKELEGKDTKSKEKSSKPDTVKTRSQQAKDAEMRAEVSNARWPRLMRSIVTDASDLFIPGAVTGWLVGPVNGPVTVGVATVVSTVLSSKDIWDKYGGKN
jgi:hypothetical protein